MRLLGPEDITPDTVFKCGELTPEELAEVYRLAREAFKPEDWDGFTEAEFEQGLPAEELIAEMEAAQNEADRKPK